MEHGCRMICADSPSVCGFVLEDVHRHGFRERLEAPHPTTPALRSCSCPGGPRRAQVSRFQGSSICPGGVCYVGTHSAQMVCSRYVGALNDVPMQLLGTGPKLKIQHRRPFKITGHKRSPKQHPQQDPNMTALCIYVYIYIYVYTHTGLYSLAKGC